MVKVENLKKITLKLEAGTSSETMDLTPELAEFEFIFGLAPEGMSPFEYELVEKNEGQQILLQLNAESSAAFFEHLHLPIANLFKERDSFFLKVTIQKIKPADSREVVRAMADMTAHGHGCDCGCGCSGISES
jgi:hypothetical protein